MSLALSLISAQREVAVFPLTLFSGGFRGAVLDRTVAASLWQNTNGTSQSTTGTDVKRHDDQSGQGYHAIEATNPPLLRAGGVEAVGTYTLTIDFGTSLGSDCTVCRAIPGFGEEFLTGQTIGSTYTITAPYAYLLIVNKAISVADRLALVTLLRTKASVTSVMWHVSIDGQSLPLGTNTNTAGTNGEVVDATNHDSRGRMFTITGGASPYGPRPWLDQAPANNNQVIVVSKVTGLEANHEAVHDIAGGRYGETIATGFIAQFLRGDTTSSDQVLVECHGRGGTGYRELGSGAGLEPGFQHFCNSLILQDLADIYTTYPRRLLCSANGHGQLEVSSGRTRALYAADVQDWTTQNHEHQRRGYHPLAATPMYISQPANMFAGNGFPIANAILDAAIANSAVVVTNSEYTELHSGGIHKRSLSNRVQGERMGRIARRRQRPQLGDTPWTGPTRPISAVRTGASIVVTFHVSDGILAVDTTLVSAIANFGIVYFDDAATASVSSAALTGDKQVTVTLNATPSGANPVLRFASTQASTQNSGPVLGGRTNLRNSIGETGVLSGVELYDWCLCCDIAVTT